MSRLRPLEGLQGTLFTHHGQPYSREAADRELRADIYEHLAAVFGRADIPADVATCPQCGGGIKALLQEPPAAYCPNRSCGWAMYLMEVPA